MSAKRARAAIERICRFFDVVCGSRRTRPRQHPRESNFADDLITTYHVLIETWLLLNSLRGREVAERFWEGLRRGGASVELVGLADLEAAWSIGEAFGDQSFSLVDRTSFAVMERLGLTTAASFDQDFAVDRYGRKRDKAFQVLR